MLLVAKLGTYVSLDNQPQSEWITTVQLCCQVGSVSAGVRVTNYRMDTTDSLDGALVTMTSTKHLLTFSWKLGALRINLLCTIQSITRMLCLAIGDSLVYYIPLHKGMKMLLMNIIMNSWVDVGGIQ